MPTDGELKKIDLPTNVKEAKQPMNTTKRSWPRYALLGLGSLVVLFLIIGVSLGVMLLPLKKVAAKAQDFVTRGKELATAVKAQNLDETKLKLADTRKSLDAVKAEYANVLKLKAVPVLGAYIKDGEHAINAGYAGLDAGQKAIEALEPNADLLGLKGKSSFVSGSADERIQMAVKTMSALTPQINEIAVSIDTLRKELDQIDPNRYPETFQGKSIRPVMISARETIDNAAGLFVNAQPLLKNLPKILGEPTEQRYLIIFQNDKELRPTGGFITAYAQFRFVRGKAILEKADDIYNLDNAMRTHETAPREIKTFHKGVYTFNLRDSNLSPDFKLSMEQFEKMYKTIPGVEKFDGIIALDTHVLVEALRILGPLYISGREFSADIDKRCDCPKAVYELEDYSTRPVGYVRTARKDIIGVLMHSMLKQALGVSPSKYWGSLFQMLISEINQKHVLTYFHDAEIQKAAESFNMAGRIMTKDETAALFAYKEGAGWDYLNINNSNMAGAKSNMFVSHKVTKEVTVDGNGTATTKLTIEYKNPYPGSDCGLESGGLCLNAPLRNWLRVYVPLGSKLTEGKGSQSPADSKANEFTTYESLGKMVFEGFLIVNPMGTAKVDLTYTSPVKSDSGKYSLLIQKQPGIDKPEYTIKVSGKPTKKIELLSDTEIQL